MDLLESVLHAAGAEKYINTLKEYPLERTTLSWLSDIDLQLMGVQEEELRSAILHITATLIMPDQIKPNVKITTEYATSILSNISNQLQFHHASLSCAVTSNDVIVCNVNLHNATQYLLNRINSLEYQLFKLEEKVGIKSISSQQQSRKKKKVKIAALSGLALLIMIGLVRAI